MVAFGSIGVYEYLYKTFNTPGEIQDILGLPIIGWLIKIKREKNAKEEIYPLTQPNSPTVEAFRSMLANLELIGTPAKPLKTLLVASSSPGDGKTTVAVNLAVSCALGGKKVVILDADLRHPRVHVFFDLENCVGLSNILECGANIQEATFKYKDVQNLNLTVIPSGAPCINPIELMKSKTLSKLLIEISQAADLVIIDSPPLIVADAQILASKVDGVLLVIKSEQSQTELVLGALDQLRRAGANMLGVALNCIPRNRISFYGGYRFDSYFQPVGSPVLDGIVSRRAGPLPRIARIFANLIKKSA
jgi:capsular exopolysaccharide synthesis family protein